MRVLLATVGLIASLSADSQRDASEDAECRTTAPNGVPEPGFYGNHALAVALSWPSGIVVFEPGGAGSVLPDGSLSMKFGWLRIARGPLTITGRRLDQRARPLRAQIPAGYGDVGFQATALIFPTPGCWEVTGRVGDTKLTFVTEVIEVEPGLHQRRPDGGGR